MTSAHGKGSVQAKNRTMMKPRHARNHERIKREEPKVIMGGGERDERLLGQLTSLNSRLAQASSAKGAMSR
ncbi:hypothetical protein BM1_01524 [Bipolaris maydis]|nr:hypothetical protein BM1_01524 [Bipolaris maydis]